MNMKPMNSNTAEKIVIVDKAGVIRKFAEKNELEFIDVTAVELVLIYLPTEHKVVLLNRGNGASDMHKRWAMHSGKITTNDLENGDGIGKKLTLKSYQNAAVREFKEELNFDLSTQRLKIIDQFYMEEKEKRLFFFLFALALDTDELKKLYPNLSEIENIRLFTLEELENNPHLGDAILFRKGKITCFLREKFASTGN